MLLAWYAGSKKAGKVLPFCKKVELTQSTVDQRTELKKETSAVEQKESAYDEVKHCAETAISLKSNIAYTTVEHTSAL